MTVYQLYVCVLYCKGCNDYMQWTNITSKRVTR